MDNSTEISLKFKNSVTGSEKLDKYAEQLNTIQAAINGLDKGALQTLQSTSTETKKASDNVDRMSKQVNTAFNYTALRTIGRMIMGIGSSFRKLTEQSSGYLEDFNLFQVAFNGNYQSAEKFVNKLSEMYGLDEDWLIRTTGLFKQMSNSMGLASDEGEKLSKLLTQMSIDISSLYNVDVDKASQVLQSSLAGQTKPIRGLTGGDITQATLQTTLDKIDTGKAVKDLDYAEKRLLIIISLTDQLSESAGDWGRTLESPANQTRILEEQWTRLTRAVGNLFLPILAKVLPYLNAILMVITEIINSIASLFGYDLGDYDYFDSSISSAYDFDDALGTVGDSLDKVKKKMSGLRSFDRLNNATTPSQTNSGGSGSVGGGISPNITKAFNKAYDDYLKKLDETKMKATEIRDKIMEWLGFTKQIDKETGKVSFKFDHLTSGTVLGAFMVGGAIYNGVRVIFGILKRLGLIKFELPSLGGMLIKLMGINKLAKTSAGLFKSIGESIEAGKLGLGGFKDIFSVFILPSLKEFLKSLGTVALRVGGVFAIVEGIVKAGNAIIDIMKNGANFDNVMKTLEGIALVVAGILTFINPIAGIIALIVAGVLTLVQAIVDNWDTIKSNVIKPALTAITTFADNIYKTIIKPIVDFVTSIAKTVYNVAIKPIVDFFAPIVEAIVSVGKEAFKQTAEIVTGVANAVWTILSKIIEIQLKIVEIFVALFKAFVTYIIKPIIETLGKAAIWFYDNVIKPIYDNYIKPAFSFIYNSVIKPIIDTFKNVGTWFYNNVISPLWNKVTWLRDSVAGAFKAIGTSVVDFIGGSIKAVINGVFAGIEKSINFFIRALNGAIKLINKIPGVNISRVSLLSLPRLKKGIEYVPSDFYPAYLDYGERVLTKEENREYTANKNNSNNDKSNNNKYNKQSAIFNIYLDHNHKLGSYVLEDLTDKAIANGKPITIGA